MTYLKTKSSCMIFICAEMNYNNTLLIFEILLVLPLV